MVELVGSRTEGIKDVCVFFALNEKDIKSDRGIKLIATDYVLLQ